MHDELFPLTCIPKIKINKKSQAFSILPVRMPSIWRPGYWQPTRRRNGLSDANSMALPASGTSHGGTFFCPPLGWSSYLYYLLPANSGPVWAWNCSIESSLVSATATKEGHHGNGYFNLVILYCSANFV
jgi:hypothetical protein